MTEVTLLWEPSKLSLRLRPPAPKQGHEMWWPWIDIHYRASHVGLAHFPPEDSSVVGRKNLLKALSKASRTVELAPRGPSAPRSMQAV
jgi:hypothetical protein